MAVEFEYMRLTVDGLTITPRMNNRVEDRALREQMLLNHNLSLLGVPKKLCSLLEIKSKSHAEKYCRNLRLTEFELFLLIHNCSQIDFTHQSRFAQYVPPERDITDSDRENLKEANFAKFANKMVALLEARKSSHIHLLERGKEWHLFYYNFSDTAEIGKTHWEGPHLHYISHLWTNYEKESLLAQFDQRKSKIFGYLHIRFVPFQYPQSLAHQAPPVSSFGVQPMLLAINSVIPSDPNSIPIPTAHVTMRGFWSTTVSIPSVRDMPLASE
jgi:hypothetical protein